MILFTRLLQDTLPKINLKTLDYEAEPGVWKNVFTVKVQPAFTQELDNVAMDWDILSTSPGKIEIQINFEKPLYISFEKEPDILVINFVDENLFITENGI